MKTSALFLFVALAFAVPASANGFLHASGKEIVDGEGRPVILRGMGLGGWMLQEGYMLQAGGLPQHVIRQKISELVGPEKTQAFYTAWLDNDITKADVDAMAGWGFNSVRLPMHYNLFMDDAARDGGPDQKIIWREDGFRRLDALISWCKANGIYVILDLHAAPGGQGNDLPISDRDPLTPSLWQSETNQDRMVALWAELAKRYKDEPAIGAYDLINEPNWGFQSAEDKNGCKDTQNAPLNALLRRTTKAIREIDSNHLIVIEGNCWGNNYDGITPDWDANMALSFHKYWNYTTVDTIQKYLNLRDTYNKPLWMGETGENSNDWFAANVRLAEDNRIGWSWWPLKKFGFNNPLQIKANPGVKKITDYWAGKGPKPSADEAYASLMTLARHDIRFENNIRHPDVIDVLFRAPFSDSAVPFKSHRIAAKGGTLRAADYDMGRNGVAYYDTTSGNYYVSTGGAGTSWNDGGTYRNDGVDLAVTADGTPFVSHMQAGEWLRYTLMAAKGGRYDLDLEGTDTDALSVILNGGNQSSRHDLRLAPGRNTLILKADASGIDLMRLRFRRAAK